MMHNILDPLMSGDPVSVEVRRHGERSVAFHIPCNARGQKFAVAPATEVVPLPSVCSTAVGPPRRTSAPPGRRPPPLRTLVPSVGGRLRCGWRNMCTPR